MKFRSDGADQIKNIMEWQSSVKDEEQGVDVSALVKDILVNELKLDVQEADRVVGIFDQRLSKLLES